MKTHAAIALLGGMILILAACTSTSEPDPGPVEAQASLVGVWVFENEAGDGTKVYSRAATLAGNRSGYEFSEHGGLKVRTSGWCGTAPLSWSNLDGLWERIDDRLLDIHHAWRGTPRHFELEIISLSPRRLTCREQTPGGS